jgi:glucose/arabinose dehydrogenase
LSRHPDFHDIPCQDVVLNGINFTSANPLTDEAEDQLTTGAYSPLGKSTAKGQVIAGQIPCSGAIFKITDTADTPELVAWGLRNPYGMAFSPAGSLYITENSFDVRGSRPVWGTGDYLWEIEEGAWYGWPDFAGSLPIHHFKPPREEKPEFLLQEHPAQPPRPTAALGVHSSSNGMAFSPGAAFGYERQVFIAQFGDMAPNVGKVMNPVGFKVVRVNVETGVIYDFAVNKGKHNGPATWLDSGGLERPIDVAFNPADNALYIVDFGILQMTDEGSRPLKNTGVIWKVTKSR